MARSTRGKKDKEEMDPSTVSTAKRSTRQKKKDVVDNSDGDVVVKKKGLEIDKSKSGASQANDNDSKAAFPSYTNKAKSVETNVLKCLDLLQFGGAGRNRSLYLKTLNDTLVQKSIKQLSMADYTGQFTRRITALAWHQKYPYALASASKFGDILFVTGTPNEGTEVSEIPLKFVTKADLEGGGAGYSITAMKFHDHDLNLLYRASIDCTVARIDLAHGETTQYHNTGDYNRWFTAMDVNCGRNMVVAGDCKGTAYQFSLDGGDMLTTWRLHKEKIHHCEFSKKDPNLLVTASLDKTDAVKIWDMRYLKKKASDLKPLCSLNHSTGLNVAKFNPVDGSRLLTSDQKDEIRIYQGPLWKDYLKIDHWHKQFQHITPIKADWHPLNDYIVIGRYPTPNSKTGNLKQRLAKAIEFFDSYTGELVDAIYPPLDMICSLNAFNPTGEYLATGMSSKLILWKPGISLEIPSVTKMPGNSSKAPLSEATRNILRGRRAREYSPAGDSDEEEDDIPKKKKSKSASAQRSTQTTTTSTASKSKPQKKKK